MPERIAKLKEIVKELETELASLDTVDAESQKVLEGALEELHTALQKKDHASLESETLSDQLRAVEEDFHVSHPTIAGLILRTINALGQFGI